MKKSVTLIALVCLCSAAYAQNGENPKNETKSSKTLEQQLSANLENQKSPSIANDFFTSGKDLRTAKLSENKNYNFLTLPSLENEKVGLLKNNVDPQFLPCPIYRPCQ
jgi:hypothetical protein